MKCLVISLAAVLICASGVAPPGSERALPTPWEDCQFVFETLDALPDWPTDRQLTSSEKIRLIKTAIAVQKSRPEMMEGLLAAYMFTGRTRRADFDESKSAQRLMVLFRVAFEVPADLTNEQAAEKRLPLRACGGFMCHAAPGVDPDLCKTRIGAPVQFDQNGFTLIAFQGPGDIGGGGSGRGYQPHWDYRYLREQFGIRPHLVRLLDEADVASLSALVD